MAVDLNKGLALPLANRAEFWIGQAELEKAKADLMAAHTLEPANEDVFLKLIRVEELLYDLPGAESDLNVLLKQDHDNGAAAQELVGLYIRLKEWKELKNFLETRLSNNAIWRVVEAQAYLAQPGRFEDAKASLEEAMKMAPDSQDILRFYLQTLIDQKDPKQYKEAIAKIKEVMNKKDLPWISALYVSALAGDGQMAEADSLFRSHFETDQGQLFDILMEQAIRAYKPSELLKRMEDWTRGNPKLGKNLKVIFYIGQVAIGAEEFKRTTRPSTVASRFAMRLSPSARLTRIRPKTRPRKRSLRAKGSETWPTSASLSG